MQVTGIEILMDQSLGTVLEEFYVIYVEVGAEYYILFNFDRRDIFRLKMWEGRKAIEWLLNVCCLSVYAYLVGFYYLFCRYHELQLLSIMT